MKFRGQVWKRLPENRVRVWRIVCQKKPMFMAQLPPVSCSSEVEHPNYSQTPIRRSFPLMWPLNRASTVVIILPAPNSLIWLPWKRLRRRLNYSSEGHRFHSCWDDSVFVLQAKKEKKKSVDNLFIRLKTSFFFQGSECTCLILNFNPIHFE